MIKEEQAEKAAPSAFLIEVAKKLGKLRELNDMSPEDLSLAIGGKVSGSYIRRLEKGLHAPTIEVMDTLLRAMKSNIGAFFEYQVDDSVSADATDRRIRRVIQRGLSGPHREDFISAIRIIERGLIE